MKHIVLVIALSLSFCTFSLAQNSSVLDSLQTELHTLFMKDQTFRRISVEAEEKLGKESDEMEYFWEVVEANDKVLEAEIIKIIDTYGW